MEANEERDRRPKQINSGLDGGEVDELGKPITVAWQGFQGLTLAPYQKAWTSNT